MVERALKRYGLMASNDVRSGKSTVIDISRSSHLNGSQETDDRGGRAERRIGQ